MIEENKRLAYNAGKETDWAVDTVAAALEVAEAAHLEGLELGICLQVSVCN